LFFKNNREFQVWELLKYSNTIDELQTGFKTKTIYAFFDDPLRGISLEPNEKMKPIPLETFKKYYETASQAWSCCQQLGDTKFEKELKTCSLDEPLYSKKGIYSHELRALIASGNLTIDEILNQVAKLKALYQELVYIRDFSQKYGICGLVLKVKKFRCFTSPSYPFNSMSWPNGSINNVYD